MKRCILPRVTAANTNLSEVLTAAVICEGTVRAFICICTVSLLISIEHIFFKISRTNSVRTVHTLTFTLVPVSLWPDTAADQQSKHSHSLKHTHGHAHASFSTSPQLSRSFHSACHVSHTLSYLQMPSDGGKDCLCLFKQVTTHQRTQYIVLCVGLLLICFPRYARMNRKQSSVCKVNSNQELEWKARVSKNVNLSPSDYRYGQPALQQRNLSCLHSWYVYSRLSTNED